MADFSPPIHATTHSGLSTWQRIQRDKPWWLLPLIVVAVLGSFGVYAFWTSVLAGNVADCSLPQFHCGPYLSPFFSPNFGKFPLPHPFDSAAIWVLWVPLVFRGSCYYYRKAYFRSFFWDPPACAIAELRHREYKGERRFPLNLNNLHRYAMYLVTIVLVFLWIDAIQSFSYKGHLGIGLGSVIMVVNVVLLTGYSAGCHAFRHMVGGCLDCFSKSGYRRSRFRLWEVVTKFNERHPMWAWISMFSVVITDIYIRLLMVHAFTDPHIWF